MNMPIPGNKILDLLISVVLIYALLSLLVSVLLEWWNHFRKARATQLKLSILQLLNDPLNLQFGELFYSHFLIDGLRNKAEKRPPQYISSMLFADVLMDIIGNRVLHDYPVELIGESSSQGKQYKLGAKAEGLTTLQRFKYGLDQLRPSPLTDTLQSFFLKCEGDQEKLKKMLASWFDDYMDRASGWFKSQQRNKLFFFGFLVAIALNVDTLHLVRVISLDDTLRNNLVEAAGKTADQYNLLSDSAKLKTDSLEQVLKKTFPKSSLRDKKKQLTLIDLKNSLRKKNDSTSKASLAKLDSLSLADSTSREYQERAERILNVATSLNIPIGWDLASAPVSWWKKSTPLNHHPSQIKATTQNQLTDYLDKRNQGGPWNVIKYLIGILITGFSLSFGAPFWFDVLVKLVNIRRAGKKPEATNVK
jgi:hypothetical protein